MFQLIFHRNVWLPRPSNIGNGEDGFPLDSPIAMRGLHRVGSGGAVTDNYQVSSPRLLFVVAVPRRIPTSPLHWRTICRPREK